MTIPLCKCGRLCAYYGETGGYSVKCVHCNAKNAKRQRDARAANQGELFGSAPQRPQETREQRSRRLRDEGIDASYEHAGEEWAEQAHALLIEYTDGLHGANFHMEDVRHYSYATGRLADPPERRAWGGVGLRCVRCVTG